VAILALSLSLSAQAGEFSTNDENLALDGYDPVAYFTQSQPVPGSPEHQTEWQDASWRFASADHQALFESNPEKYAPRYGGFCAGGMSLGRKVKIDPEAWMIVDGKLFMGGASTAIDYMKKDTEAKIIKADENWETLRLTN
jgi:hypothetical protein